MDARVRLFVGRRVARAWLIFPSLERGSGQDPYFGVMGVVKIFRTVLQARAPIRLASYAFLEGQGTVDVRFTPPADGGGEDGWVTWRRRLGSIKAKEVPRGERAGVTVFPLRASAIPATMPANWSPSGGEHTPVLQPGDGEHDFEEIPQWLEF